MICAGAVAALSVSGGSDTVTLDNNGETAALIDVYIYEISGVDISHEGYNNFGSGCTLTSCSDSVSTSTSASFNSGDFLFASIADENGASSIITPGTGFMQSTQVSGDHYGFAQYGIAETSSTTNFPATVPGLGTPSSGAPSGNWVEAAIDLPVLPTLPAPIFPLGTILAIAVPLAALGFYFTIVTTLHNRNLK